MVCMSAASSCRGLLLWCAHATFNFIMMAFRRFMPARACCASMCACRYCCCIVACYISYQPRARQTFLHTCKQHRTAPLILNTVCFTGDDGEGGTHPVTYSFCAQLSPRMLSNCWRHLGRRKEAFCYCQGEYIQLSWLVLASYGGREQHNDSIQRTSCRHRILRYACHTHTAEGDAAFYWLWACGEATASSHSPLIVSYLAHARSLYAGKRREKRKNSCVSVLTASALSDNEHPHLHTFHLLGKFSLSCVVLEALSSVTTLSQTLFCFVLRRHYLLHLHMYLFSCGRDGLLLHRFVVCALPRTMSLFPVEKRRRKLNRSISSLVDITSSVFLAHYRVWKRRTHYELTHTALCLHTLLRTQTYGAGIPMQGRRKRYARVSWAW